jgi:phosphatidylserine/phosphatidylglycerophosphate/cardiolipin synthase-like enzyme
MAARAGIDDWFLTPAERGNVATSIDRRHHDGTAWTTGNRVVPLVHGARYFRRLVEEISSTTRDDRVYFTDWRGDPDERLLPDGPDVGSLFADAARRGVVVKALIWRSHSDRFQFSQKENRRLGDEINDAGGEAILDQRVRVGGSHHQKLVVIRRPGRPEDDVAFVGGIDLSRSRRDDDSHSGDPQRQPMSERYGDRPPWHDIQAEVHGPAVADLERVFVERWQDPARLAEPWHPARLLHDRLANADVSCSPLPPELPVPSVHGTHAVQVLRTYPARSPAYPFAPQGERSIARAYKKALRRARRLVYIEDQYFWSHEVASTFARALRDNPRLHLIAVVPRFSDQDGALAVRPNLAGRRRAFDRLFKAAGDRVAIYDRENDDGVPVYVHAKACVVDDVWCTIGSDNVNRRSWTHDSELTIGILDDVRDQREPVDPAGLGDGARTFARDLRLLLWTEHLGRAADDVADLIDPETGFAAFRAAADELAGWYDGGQVGPRPAARLRAHDVQPQPKRVTVWAVPVYRMFFDPDGRPLSMRLRRRW